MKKRADVKKHYMCTNRNATIIINVSSFLYKSAAINKEAKKKKPIILILKIQDYFYNLKN